MMIQVKKGSDGVGDAVHLAGWDMFSREKERGSDDDF